MNNMEVQVSPVEARVNFNEIIPEGKVIRVERRASLVMSIPHLRAMAQVLAKYLPAETVDPSKKD